MSDSINRWIDIHNRARMQIRLSKTLIKRFGNILGDSKPLKRLKNGNSR